MDNERWRKIEEVFQDVAERDPADRNAYLTQVCGDDRELRREVESLLAHDVFDTFIQEPIEDSARSLADDSDHDLIGQRLGPYRVAELIGHGGMGVVYAAARDDDQFNQRVAVKIVRRGMDTSFVLSRFRHERQILASLEHPNIARLLDGGTTEGGRPYFVMEFIEGPTITEFCAANRLSIAERIKLFRRVCSAVQYAHQKLIVHRDLKPSNILVTASNGKDGGAPKLLDFGIAKLLDPAQSAADPARTATVMRMMTPDYASPEQVRGLTITTATDVYSLGAVLYELLTGQRPHRFQTYTPTEIERVVCEIEVEPPSKAASQAANQAASQTASQAAGESDGLSAKARKQLSGDLDNIILMAMRKEPERRYQSVEQFSDDLLRYLEERPVIARGDTTGYRAGKFIRRHRLGVAATALVIASLLGGLIAANYQARRAERRFAQVRKLANTFLFDFHDKIEKLPGSTEAREMVVKTALEYLDSLAQEAAGDPALQLELARAYLRVGDVQGDLRAANLGQVKASALSYQKGLALAENLAAGAPDNTALFETLTELHLNLGAQHSLNGDVAGGIAELRQALSAAEKINARNPNKRQHLVMLIQSHEALGDAELSRRNIAAALDNHRRTLQLCERRAAEFPNDPAQHGLALALSRLGDTQAEQGDLAATLESYRRSLLIHEALVKKLPDNAVYRREMKVAYNWAGNFSGNPRFLNLGDSAAALRYYRQGLVISEELAAADPKNSLAKFDLGVSYEKMGDILSEIEPAQAAEFYRRALSAMSDVLTASPNQHRFLRRHAVFLWKRGATLRNLGDHKGALQNLHQALESLQALAAKSPSNAELQGDLHATFTALADALTGTGERAEALNCGNKSLALAEKMVAANPADLYAQWWLAKSYSGLGRYHESLASTPKSRLAERIANWKQARDWRQKALSVWDEWPKHAVSNSFDLTRREQAARAVAQCQAMLEKLSAAPQR